MTRKRFIKLLMARGYSRNEAQELAQEGYEGESYAEKYIKLSLWQSLPDDALETIADAAWRACEAACEAVQYFLEELPRVAQSINDAILAVIKIHADSKQPRKREEGGRDDVL